MSGPISFTINANESPQMSIYSTSTYSKYEDPLCPVLICKSALDDGVSSKGE